MDANVQALHETSESPKKELQQLQETFAAINNSQAIIEFNLDGTIITANKNFLNALNYSIEEIAGQHHKLFVELKEQQSPAYKLFWQNLNEGKFQSNVFKRIGKNGKEIWLRATYNPVFNEQGKPYKVIKFASDITEERIKNADHEGQIAAISSSQAVIEFEMDGTIISANDNFLNAVNYKLEEVQGRHHSIFVETKDKESKEYQQFWHDLNQGDFQMAEYKRLGKNGKEVWLQATYNPIFDLNGKPFKVVKYATDITARKFAIEQIKQMLMNVSEGDLTQKITADLDGDFAILKNALNDLIDNLVKIFSEIREASTYVFTDAKEISAGTYDLSQRTESQASSLEETASAMEELTSTVQQNAENTTEASKIADGVMVKAGDGGAVINEAINAMTDIDKSSKKIADIIGVIDEIAFQTNLLALNAAVEAARAGEQGRGFAVVAAEVRNLAQRSAGAAKEIKGLINDSVEAVQKGSSLVDRSGKTFEELVHAVQQVVNMISDINNAGNEQAAGINEVSQAVAQMDEMTQQNAALVEEASASTKSLEEQAQGLLDQISYFNIE